MSSRLLFWLTIPIVLAAGLSLEQSYLLHDRFNFGDFAGILCFVVPKIVFFSFVFVTIIDSTKWQASFHLFFRSMRGILFMLIFILSIVFVRMLTSHTDSAAFVFVEIASGILLAAAYYVVVDSNV